MSKENKGREFWIHNEGVSGQDLYCRFVHGFPTQEKIHVIEYSAFEKCQGENEKLTDEIWQATEANAAANMKIDALEQRLADAVELNEKYHEALENIYLGDWSRDSGANTASDYAEETLGASLADGSKDE